MKPAAKEVLQATVKAVVKAVVKNRANASGLEVQRPASAISAGSHGIDLAAPLDAGTVAARRIHPPLRLPAGFAGAAGHAAAWSMTRSTITTAAAAAAVICTASARPATGRVDLPA